MQPRLVFTVRHPQACSFCTNPASRGCGPRHGPASHKGTTMTYYAYACRDPRRAAAELREAGYEAFCLMRHDRRKVSRHAKRKDPKPVLALAGYAFAADVDPWTASQMRHVGRAVVFNGKRAPIPPKQMEWLLRPPQPFFHDTDIPRYVNRPAPPLVKAGDMVRFTLAAEQHTLPVDSVDGEILVMRINMLGREIRTRVPVHMVEVAA